MENIQLRQLIKESIQEYIREVEASGNIAAQEAKIRACEEAIALREKKANLEGIDETMHEMIDGAKINELKKEIKELQKYKSKAEKVLDKMKTKAEGKMSAKSTEDEGMMDEVIDEVTIDPHAGAQLEAETEQVYEMLLMQKRAGIISETEYKAKLEEVSSSKKVQMLLNRLASLIPGQEQEFLEFMAKTANSAMDYSGASTDELAKNFIAFEENENDEEFTPEVMNDVLKIYIPAFKRGDGIFEAKKKASAGLTKKQKSAISKKAHAGKDIGKKGKGFEKVAKAGEKQYGSKEAGEKVAAAAMWKNAAKK